VGDHLGVVHGREHRTGEDDGHPDGRDRRQVTPPYGGQQDHRDDGYGDRPGAQRVDHPSTLFNIT